MRTPMPVRKRTAHQPRRDEEPPRRSNDLRSYIVQLEGKLQMLHGQVRQAQQLAQMGTSAAILAHEASNLMTPIINYVERATDSGNMDLQRKALAVVGKNARILVAMSERVLRISAAESLRIEDVPLRTTIDDAADSLCRDLSKDGITFTNKVAGTLVVRADALSLQQAFFNLFLNARDALAPRHGGRITATADQADDRVTIHVSDNGGGIPEEILPLVFEPLQSSKAAQAAGSPRCKGLGLAVCRNLVDELDGTIRVETVDGDSTTFAITLPSA